IATAVWLPMIHLLFRPSEATVAAMKAALRPRLEASQLRLWRSQDHRRREQERMRRSNAEWDFMGRSYLVWSLANICFADPARRTECLETIDLIIDETLRLEHDAGMKHFLMPYARAQPYRMQPARSQFLDSEIALMLGMRRLLSDRDDYRRLLTERIQTMHDRMRAAPVLCAESYPNECWMFDNVNALVSMRITDDLDGTNHSGLIGDWIDIARRRLVDSATGMLITSFTLDGARRDGPEGSSIWMIVHALQLVAPDFAHEQYARAKHELACDVLGFS